MHRVVVGALVRGAEVLLVHRSASKRAYPNVWDLPGGVIEAGETELVALARELHEELGVRIATDSTSFLFQVQAAAAGDQVLLRGWLVREWQGTPANTAPEEHDGIGWFSLDQLPAPAHEEVLTALVTSLRAGSPG